MQIYSHSFRLVMTIFPIGKYSSISHIEVSVLIAGVGWRLKIKLQHDDLKIGNHSMVKWLCFRNYWTMLN